MEIKKSNSFKITDIAAGIEIDSDGEVIRIFAPSVNHSSMLATNYLNPDAIDALIEALTAARDIISPRLPVESAGEEPYALRDSGEDVWTLSPFGTWSLHREHAGCDVGNCGRSLDSLDAAYGPLTRVPVSAADE